MRMKVNVKIAVGMRQTQCQQKKMMNRADLSRF